MTSVSFYFALASIKLNKIVSQATCSLISAINCLCSEENPAISIREKTANSLTSTGWVILLAEHMQEREDFHK